jgi:signal transduction histidine kinase
LAIRAVLEGKFYAEILAALRAERHIVAACLYDKQGRLFARYPTNAAESAFPRAPREDGYRFENGRVVGFTPLVQVRGRDRLGTLYLSSDLGELRERLRLYGMITLLVIFVSSSVAYLLSRIFEGQISRPILALADTAKAVSLRRDYAVRASQHGADELGLLTDAFNHMLARIEEQNAMLEKRVRERTAELESANDELEAFCSSAAHDLRTPLRAIIGFTDVLLDERATDLPPEAKRYVSSIRAGSAQMSQLIEDLLSFSRVGRQDLTRKTVSLDALCRRVITEMDGEQGSRRVDVQVRSLPEVYGDPALLRLVFVNLLSNALKYTRPRDQAVIEIGALEKEGETGPVIFVRDNGVGFEMENAGKLFGVFQRLHHAREFEGAGDGPSNHRTARRPHLGRGRARSRSDVLLHVAEAVRQRRRRRGQLRLRRVWRGGWDVPRAAPRAPSRRQRDR